jgi:hypothetical protein
MATPALERNPMVRIAVEGILLVFVVGGRRREHSHALMAFGVLHHHASSGIKRGWTGEGGWTSLTDDFLGSGRCGWHRSLHVSCVEGLGFSNGLFLVVGGMAAGFPHNGLESGKLILLGGEGSLPGECRSLFALDLGVLEIP